MEIIIELILQVLFEITAEVSSRGVKKIFKIKEKVTPVEKTPLYSIMIIFFTIGFGVVVAYISLLLFPFHFIKTPWMQWINLISTPLIAGFVMSRIGIWLHKNGKKVSFLDTFSYGFCFALAMTTFRFIFCI